MPKTKKSTQITVSTTTAAAPPLRDLASTLPPELLLMMFDLPYDSHAKKSDKQEKLKELKNYSLVCRAWRAVLMHYLVEVVRIKSVARMKELEAHPGSGGAFISSLIVDVEKDKERWNTRSLAKVLQRLPHLTELHLALNEGSPGPRASYRNIAALDLSGIKSLTIFVNDYDATLSAYQQILKVTPNIESLTLGTVPSSHYRDLLPLAHEPVNAHIDLPRLSQLTLLGCQLRRNFIESCLLSDSSFCHITELSLVQIGYYELNWIATNLLEKVGSNILTLRLIGDIFYYYEVSSLEKTLSFTPSVQTLVVGPGFLPKKPLPATIQTLVLSGNMYSAVGTLRSWECGPLKQDVCASATLTRIEIERCDLTEARRKGLATSWGREIFVEGTKYAPAETPS